MTLHGIVLLVQKRNISTVFFWLKIIDVWSTSKFILNQIILGLHSVHLGIYAVNQHSPPKNCSITTGKVPVLLEWLPWNKSNNFKNKADRQIITV